VPLAIKHVAERGYQELGVNVNYKTLNGDVNVTQIECGVADPVKFFSDSLIVNIPRSRDNINKT
jgi:hypothetical protein